MRDRIKEKVVGFGPISYPAKPYFVGSIPTFDTSGWYYTPMVKGDRLVYHVTTQRAFDRKGYHYSPETLKPYDESLDIIKAMSPHPWVDCIMIPDGGILIRDLMDDKRWFDYRQKNIEEAFLEVDVSETHNKSVFFLPEYGRSSLSRLKSKLAEINDDLGIEYYVGILGRKRSAPYPLQKSNPNRPTEDWHYCTIS